MFEHLKRLYLQGRIDLIGLNNAVTKGWITQEQLEEIVTSNERTEE